MESMEETALCILPDTDLPKTSNGSRVSKRSKKWSRARSPSCTVHPEEPEVEYHILHKKQKPVEMKCFRTEVRGLMDINSFMEQSKVLLDVHATNLEMIVDKLLDAMLSNSTGKVDSAVSQHDVKSLVFANPERTLLSDFLQGTESRDGTYHFEQTWIIALCNVPTIVNRLVGISRLHIPINLGEDAEEVQFFMLILCPTSVKGTKTSLEFGRTFATLFSDMEVRHSLMECHTPTEFKQHLRGAAEHIAAQQSRLELTPQEASMMTANTLADKAIGKPAYREFGRGIRDDLIQRAPFYWSDYRDGIIGNKAIQKTISTTMFLYFSVLLPAIAFGNLQDDNTGGQINLEKIMIGQVFGGLVFALFAGQPLVVVMTTAPLVLFTKIILAISVAFSFPFLPFFALVGIWNSFFLLIYSTFNLSFLMNYSSRSTEEIFSNFISIALVVDAIKHVVADFSRNYCYAVSPTIVTATAAANFTNLTAITTASTGATVQSVHPCQPEASFLYVLLMLGTVWLGATLFNFIKTPYLSHRKREMLSDYALPVAVVVFSAIGTGLFNKVPLDPFMFRTGTFVLAPVDFSQVTAGAVLGAALVGFTLSILFFMDQNISAAMVNAPENKLKKGNAYHWDLVVVAVINGILAVFGLPFMHAVLPHSPLHVRSLADVETRVEGGYARDVVMHVRETRLTNLFSNMFIGLSILFLPYVLQYVPKAVLDGLFLYMALTPLYGNQMFERITLFLTEQAAYPPNHYVKRVPQRKMHMFTVCQILQLGILCVFGFTPWPYIKMIFPLVILAFLPVRRKLLPLVIEKKFLEALDPSHQS